jgi:hypothetical protein
MHRFGIKHTAIGVQYAPFFVQTLPFLAQTHPFWGSNTLLFFVQIHCFWFKFTVLGSNPLFLGSNTPFLWVWVWVWVLNHKRGVLEPQNSGFEPKTVDSNKKQQRSGAPKRVVQVGSKWVYQNELYFGPNGAKFGLPERVVQVGSKWV